MITHLEPDILECEVRWALGSITMNKANGGDGIPVELFQMLKDDAVKVLHSICQQIWETQQWPQDWKRSVFIPISKKGNAKECSNYCTIALISHASWRRQWQPTLVLLPGKSHGQRSLVGCSPWVAKCQTRLSDFTFTFIKRLFSSSFFCHKGGVICISEVTDISPSNLDSSLCFIQPRILHDVHCTEVK